MLPGTKKQQMTLTALERCAIIGLDRYLAEHPSCKLQLVDVINHKFTFLVNTDEVVSTVESTGLVKNAGISYYLSPDNDDLMVIEVFYTGAGTNHIDIISTLEQVSQKYLSELLKPKHA